jgi:hypothetical protein
MRLTAFPALICAIVVASCGQRVEPFGVWAIDRTIDKPSDYPVPSVVQLVGTYSGTAKSGSGYFYDDVLEYRVWLHPERGAKDLASGKDYFAAFARYEAAAAFSKSTPGAEAPLALVQQLEWLDEPEPGHFDVKHGRRIAEWQPQWLALSKRSPTSVEDVLKNPHPASESENVTALGSSANPR